MQTDFASVGTNVALEADGPKVLARTSGMIEITSTKAVSVSFWKVKPFRFRQVRGINPNVEFRYV